MKIAGKHSPYTYVRYIFHVGRWVDGNWINVATWQSPMKLTRFLEARADEAAALQIRAFATDHHTNAKVYEVEISALDWLYTPADKSGTTYEERYKRWLHENRYMAKSRWEHAQRSPKPEAGVPLIHAQSYGKDSKSALASIVPRMRAVAEQSGRPVTSDTVFTLQSREHQTSFRLSDEMIDSLGINEVIDE